MAPAASDDLPRVDVSDIATFVNADVLDDAHARVAAALGALEGRTCAGSEMTGWLDLPHRMRGEPAQRIVQSARSLAARHEALVVVGIGGSSLGTRAALAALGRGASDSISPLDDHPVVFAGHHLSADVLHETLRSLGDRDVAVNVVSKSGTTVEPGIAFRVLLRHLRDKHGDGWRSRVVVTTDERRGALRALAEENGLESFPVPDDVGGRFSVLTAVGLFPLAFAGLNVDALLEGAADLRARVLVHAPDPNPAIALAGARCALYASGYSVDVLSFTHPRLRALAAWWQQLFGESEGKSHRGAFPATLEIPADLHSLGQYLQDGVRQIYETFLSVEHERETMAVPPGDGRDGLDYLAGREIAEVLEAARRGTMAAHLSGGVPVLEITATRLAERELGALFFLFETTVALSGACLGVNPFDQPGVEAYKTNMFRLLGRTRT